MNKIMFALIAAAVLSGCAPTNQASGLLFAADQPVYQPQRAAEAWQPLTAGSDLSYNANYQYHPSEMKLSNQMLLRGQDWDGYLKNYVESFPEEKRDAILQGVTRHFTSYDRVEQFIRFEPTRYMSGPYSRTKHVGLVGILRPDGATASAKFHFYSSDWIFAQSIKVMTDGESFQSPTLDFHRDNSGGNVWEIGYLSLSNPEYKSLIKRIVNSKEAIIRFQGKRYYSDLEVTDRMRQDMGAMLAALEAIGL